MTSQPPNTGFSLRKGTGELLHILLLYSLKILQNNKKLHSIGYIQHNLILNARMKHISNITVTSL